VLSGKEEALVKFYSTKRHTPVLGCEDFVEWVRAGEFSFSGEHVDYETGVLRPGVSSLIREVAKVYKVSEETLFHSRRGRSNEARQVAMHLIRELCETSLRGRQETKAKDRAHK
jgi:putative transposase